MYAWPSVAVVVSAPSLAPFLPPLLLHLSTVCPKMLSVSGDAAAGWCNQQQQISHRVI